MAADDARAAVEVGRGQAVGNIVAAGIDRRRGRLGRTIAARQLRVRGQCAHRRRVQRRRLPVADDVVVFRAGTCDGTIYDPAILGVRDGSLRSLAWHQEEMGKRD